MRGSASSRAGPGPRSRRATGWSSGRSRPRGATVEARPWNDVGAAWDGFDAVVLRSNWDYHFEPDAFLGWLDRLERAGARVFNPPALVRWNLTKAYLLELARAGVPTVATVILEDEPRRGLEALMAARAWRRVVMKPVISASAHDTRLVSAATMDEAVGALASGAIRRPVLVQPFVEEIQTRGEWSLVFIETEMTHAVLKRPAAGRFPGPAPPGGTVETPAAPTGRAVARAALAALPTPALRAHRRDETRPASSHGGRGQRARTILPPAPPPPALHRRPPAADLVPAMTPARLSGTGTRGPSRAGPAVRENPARRNRRRGGAGRRCSPMSWPLSWPPPRPLIRAGVDTFHPRSVRYVLGGILPRLLP